MAATLPQILRDNMDAWRYDDDGKMIAVKGASFGVIKAIKEMNQLEESVSDTKMIIDD